MRIDGSWSLCDDGVLRPIIQGAVKDAGGAWVEGKYVPSLLAAIGEVIERHMIEIGFLPARPGHAEPAAQVVNLEAERPPGTTLGLLGPRLRQCPKCGEAALIRLEGCDQCTSCDYSKCG